MLLPRLLENFHEAERVRVEALKVTDGVEIKGGQQAGDEEEMQKGKRRREEREVKSVGYATERTAQSQPTSCSSIQEVSKLKFWSGVGVAQKR